MTVVPLHPLGIKPAGNAYTSSSNIRATIGIFNSLADELIVQVLEHLHSTSLLQLGATCKALYAFSRLEDLWKALFIGYAGFHLSRFGQSVFSLVLCFGCVDHHCRVGACCSITVDFLRSLLEMTLNTHSTYSYAAKVLVIQEEMIITLA